MNYKGLKAGGILTNARPKKTHEEYLIENEKRIVESFKDVHKSIDKNIVTIYATSFVLLMVRGDYITELNILGSKLNLNLHNITMVTSSILLMVYILTTYKLS